MILKGFKIFKKSLAAKGDETKKWKLLTMNEFAMLRTYGKI